MGVRPFDVAQGKLPLRGEAANPVQVIQPLTRGAVPVVQPFDTPLHATQGDRPFDTRFALLRMSHSPRKPQGSIEGRSVHAFRIKSFAQRLSVCI